MNYENNTSSDVKLRVTYNPNPVTSKPQGYEVGEISNGLTEVGNWTVTELIRYTQPPCSYTIAPATFEDNKRKNKYWLSQQVFMLDFDSGISVKEVYDKFEAHGITPNFYYLTFSNTKEHPRFRVGLIADEEIQNPELASFIRKGLVLAFKEDADQSCKDGSRMFFPGSQSVETNLTPIPLSAIYEFSSLHVISNDKFRKRQLLAETTVGFSINKGDSRFDQNSSNELIKDPRRLEYLENFKTSGVTVADLSGKVKIYDDFIMGEHLSYHELKGLATNLQYISGGQKTYFNTLNATGTYKDCDYALFHYVKNYKYYPSRLKNFSPHEEDHRYSDLIEAIRKPKRISQTKFIEKIPLEGAERTMKLEFENALKADGHDIYLFKTATGLGKTKLLEPLDDVTVCFPNHKLKEEADNRFTSEHICVPAIPHFMLESLNEQVSLCYKLGLNTEVRELIQAIAKGENGYDEFPEDVDLAHNYLKAESNARSADLTVLSTHLRGLFNQSQHDTLIFDEDPLNSIFEMDSFKISDLKLLDYDLKDSALAGIIDELEAAEVDTVHITNLHLMDDRELRDIAKGSERISGNVIKFFQSSTWIKSKDNKDTINYVVRRDLPVDKKVFIMSATASVAVYKALYGDRLKVIDLSHVEQKGRVVQYVDRSYSRASIKGLSKGDLTTRCKTGKVITFKRYKDAIPESIEGIYFHNTEGFDSFKGEDITVLGSPHYPELVYKLYAKEIGLDLSSNAFDLKPRMVDRNGFRFQFTSFEDKRLQDLQLSLIESELIQAVGRARVLRTDATVTVYSNLPLPMVDEIHCNFDGK